MSKVDRTSHETKIQSLFSFHNIIMRDEEGDMKPTLCKKDEDKFKFYFVSAVGLLMVYWFFFLGEGQHPMFILTSITFLLSSRPLFMLYQKYTSNTNVNKNPRKNKESSS